MAERNIITGQHVRIEQTPAKTVERIGAFCIDALIALAYAYCMGHLANYISVSGDAGTAALVFLVVLPLLLYVPLCETLWNGQTVGKRLLKLRTVKVDGSSPDLGSFVLRWILLIVDMLFFGAFAAFSMLVTPRRQRIGDLAAGTMVIRLNTYDKIRVSLDEFAFVDDGYQPRFSQAVALTAAEATRIQHALADRSTSRRHRIRQLASEMQQRLQLAVDGDKPEPFLARLLSDYRYYDFYQV